MSSDPNPELRTEDLARSPRPTAGEKLCSGSDLRGVANLAGIEEGRVKAMRGAAAITVLERRRRDEEDGRSEQQVRMAAGGGGESELNRTRFGGSLEAP